MVMFAADEITLSAPDHPALVIDLMERRDPFRCVTSELWAVDNNLNLANMDWEEFASAAEDGIFRGV